MTSRDENVSFDPAVVDGLRAALDDDELLGDITGSFLAEAPGHLSALASAQRAGDFRGIATTAHLIRGSALTFGANRLVDLCAQLESSPAEATSLVGVVEQEYGEFSRALVAYLDPLV